MPKEEALSYLEDQLAAQIYGFDDSRKFYRRKLFQATMATSVLSASTTVLIALDKALNLEVFSIIALVFSSSITIISAYDQFLRSREIWVQKTDTWMLLQNLQAHLQYSKAKLGELTQEQIDDLYKRFDEIIMSEHEAWKKVRVAQSSISAKSKK